MTKRSFSIETVLAMILFVIFLIAMVLMVLSGKNTYENIIKSKNKNEDKIIINSYFMMKLKQADQEGSIKTGYNHDYDFSTLTIKLKEEPGFELIIFFYDGYVYELYKEENEDLKIDYGEKIVKLEDIEKIDFIEDENTVTIKYIRPDSIKDQVVSLNSENALVN